MEVHDKDFDTYIEDAKQSRNRSYLKHGVKTDTATDLPTCLSKRGDLPPLQRSERRMSTHSEKKSVTFSVSGGERSNHILNASDCFTYMRKGSEMIKLHTSGRQYKRVFYLNEQMNCIKWSSSSSNKRQSNSQIDIEEIHEVQLGCSSRTTHSLGRRRPLSLTPTLAHNFLSSTGSGSLIQSPSRNYSNNSNSLTIGSMSPQLHSSSSLNTTVLNLSSSAFTICYGPDFTVLEILASGPEEANIWVTGLKCLMAGAQDPQVLEDRQKPRDRWLQLMFHEADSTNQGHLSEFEVIRLIRSINPSLSSTHLRHKLKEMESKLRDHKGRITRDDFVNFFKKVATRQEIYYILVRYSSGAEHLTAEDLKNFFESEQGRTGLTLEKCTALINRFEPSHENRQYNLMGIDGFTSLLLSEECDIFNPAHLQVCQDMSQPITHYYIASSHKTFLLEDQLTGPCSIEGYQRALLSGCRYIELEVYDGHDGHPVVRRLNSRPPGIPIQAVLNTIHDFAFTRSEYPVIISIECYASQAQQSVLATFLRCCLGHRLILPNSEFTFNLSESQLEMEDQVEKARYTTITNNFTSTTGGNKPYRKNSLTVVDLKNESTVYASDGSHVRWPSPRDLIGRILLKGKRLPKGTTTTSIVGNESEKWMNGGLPNIRRAFTSSYATSCQQQTTIIRELSDMFFFDTTNYEHIPNSDSLRTSISLGFKHALSSSSFRRGSVKNDHSHRSPHSTSSASLTSSPVVIVGGAHSETNSSLTTLKTFQYQSRAKLKLGDNSESKDKNNSKDKNITSDYNRSSGNATSTTTTATKHCNQDKLHLHPYYIIIMSESEASRAIGTGAGELVQLTRNSLIQICPSPSRADSSNLNPLDIWAWGGQIVSLNYQTAGLVMDLATGFFARNGACGYVLKPSLYRQFSSFFTPYKSNLLNIAERPPDTTPQVLRLKIVSAQQLPKPRGSVSKGDTIEPYVVVEIHGIPVDCAEQRTVTAPAGSASGYNAIFEDTFEFCVQLGSLALVRFVVLDDHAIGDDFIGQNTVPFDCLLTGFRHVRLRSDTGEPIPLATLFVHITITTRTDSSQGENHTGLLHKWRSRNRQQLQLKKVGVSTFDDIFKATTTTLRQACELRTSVLTNFDNFRRLCGETSTPLSMNQCIRALSTRIGTSFGSPDLWPVRMRIRLEDEMPHLELQSSFMGSGLSVYPSLNTLGDSSQALQPSSSSSSTRNSSLRFSPAPGLHRSPSLILSPRLFLNRRLKSSSKSIDEDASSALSIDVSGCHSSVNSHSHSTHDHSPTISTTNMARRQSIHSSNSSISSFSVGRLDKMKKTVNEFEALIESCKTLIKQGPYLRVKLQQTQRTALEAYTTFLEGLKAPSSHATTISRLTSSSRSSISRGSEALFSSVTPEISRRVSQQSVSDSVDAQNKMTSGTITSGTSIYWRRMSRVADNVTWNLRLLTGQVELLTLLLNESSEWIKQAKESSTATGLLIKTDVSSLPDANSSPTYADKDQFISVTSIENALIHKPTLPIISCQTPSRRSTISNESFTLDSDEAGHSLIRNLLTPLPESPCSNQLFNTYDESDLKLLPTILTTTTTGMMITTKTTKSISKISSLYNFSSSTKITPTTNETLSVAHNRTSSNASPITANNKDNNSNKGINSTVINTNSTITSIPTTKLITTPTTSGNLSRIRNRFNQAWKK